MVYTGINEQVPGNNTHKIIIEKFLQKYNIAILQMQSLIEDQTHYKDYISVKDRF